jgi:hypothetical protein
VASHPTSNCPTVHPAPEDSNVTQDNSIEVRKLINGSAVQAIGVERRGQAQPGEPPETATSSTAPEKSAQVNALIAQIRNSRTKSAHC